VNPERAARLAGPLENFTALHERTVLRHASDLIDLSFPNPMAGRDPRAFDLLRSAAAEIDQAHLQYTPLGGGPVVRRLTAAALRRRTGAAFGVRDVVLTPGAAAALAVAFAALFEPGDEVVVVTPCWMDYPLQLESRGVRPVLVPSGADLRIDLDRLAGALGPRTAGVVLGQPVCPTGVLHTGHELRALAEVLEQAAGRFGRRPVLVSDEAHRDQVWGDEPFAAPVLAYPDVVSVYSFGKAWALQGQRTGYLAIGPRAGAHDEIVRRVERALRYTGTCAPTALMQELVRRLADLDPQTHTLREDQQRFRELIARVGLAAVPAQATAFVYVRCPPGLDDWGFVRRMADQGLLAMPSELFHDAGHVRFALNLPGGRAPLAEVENRLRRAAAT
jgi:aspartate aminotransferase